ncbi:MAG: very short patch repair endonuclease [Candidatus Bathyarchaeota archaeon]|nr:very short patch repair endonuclease [Candidatus Bathyarchaeota archaeon]
MDNLTPEQRRKTMQRIRSTDTKAERMIINELKKRGLQFTRYDKALIGKPDIVFSEKRIAVFIDSDFWHCNPKRFIKPQSNVEYWRKKIEQNKKRDRLVNRELKKAGWTVIRIWEYDVKHDLEKSIKKILSKLYGG